MKTCMLSLHGMVLSCTATAYQMLLCLYIFNMIPFLLVEKRISKAPRDSRATKWKEPPSQNHHGGSCPPNINTLSAHKIYLLCFVAILEFIKATTTILISTVVVRSILLKPQSLVCTL